MVQVLLAASETLTENVLEGLYMLKIRDSVQLQTVLSTYDQENDRNPALSSCQRLKTMERRHTDQMCRTRNFKARNERIETGVLVESHGRKSALRGQWENCYWWKAAGQCSRGDSCSFSHGILDREYNPLLLQRRRHRLTGEDPRKVLVPGRKSFWKKRLESRSVV